MCELTTVAPCSIADSIMAFGDWKPYDVLAPQLFEEMSTDVKLCVRASTISATVNTTEFSDSSPTAI